MPTSGAVIQRGSSGFTAAVTTISAIAAWFMAARYRLTLSAISRPRLEARVMKCDPALSPGSAEDSVRAEVTAACSIWDGVIR